MIVLRGVQYEGILWIRRGRGGVVASRLLAPLWWVLVGCLCWS